MAEHPTPSVPYSLRVDGMNCAACVRNVEQAVMGVDKVASCTVNLFEKKAVVSGGVPQKVLEAILQHGYDASLIVANHTEDSGTDFFWCLKQMQRMILKRMQ
ncbi:MAG: heavy-metal-associated domain-containing protein [Candidatus Electrothrix sp. AR4]|nr:heavy-metal-associated domain-containing protein [Candidatus Electrothrix sp. AR4]